jgi:hypothetical protein
MLLATSTALGMLIRCALKQHLVLLSCAKKHVSYIWIVSSVMVDGQKRGVRPNPLEPPLCTDLLHVHSRQFQMSLLVIDTFIIFPIKT